VKIDSDVRIVVTHREDERASLRRVQLHVIPVDVQTLGIRPRSHPSDRTVLQRPVRQLHTLVSIGVEDRRDQNDERVQLSHVPTFGELPEQHQQHLLSLDLPRMDVALEVQNGLPGRANGFRAAVGEAADHSQRQWPPFHRVTKGPQVNQRRSVSRDSDELHHFRVAGRFPPLGSLRGRPQIGCELTHEGCGSPDQEKENENNGSHGACAGYEKGGALKKTRSAGTERV
jgi:hypothetical protein